jgi:hypothetical protein
MAKQNYGGAYDSDREIPWNLGEVSSDGGEDSTLHTDDGGVRDLGAINADHAVDRAHGGYNKGSGFSQPSDKDFGPPDSWTGAGFLDDKSGQQPEWNPCSDVKSSHADTWTDQPIPASAARARKGSAHEYFSSIDDVENSYGDSGNRRQG